MDLFGMPTFACQFSLENDTQVKKKIYTIFSNVPQI